MRILFYITIVLFCSTSYAYEINAYDHKTKPGIIIMEIVDLCKKSHKKEFDKNELGTIKTLEWLKFLREEKILDKCNNPVDSE